jgi:hypothetical protein
VQQKLGWQSPDLLDTERRSLEKKSEICTPLQVAQQRLFEVSAVGCERDDLRVF